MAKFWTNQSVTMQSAIGAAQTVTAVSKASNGQVTTSGTLPSNNAIVLLEVTGMTQVHRRLFKVSGATGSTFNIGVDTTQFSTFVSGSFKVLTMANAFSGVRDINASGGEGVFEDTTTVHDVSDTQEIVSSSPEQYSFTNDWVPTDAALKECNLAFITRTPRGFLFTDPDGSQYMFFASVAAPLNPTVSGRKKVTPVTLSLLATGTSY